MLTCANNISNFSKYATEINPEEKNSSHSQIVFNVCLGDLVLDVGCACGDLGKYLYKVKNCEVWGIEYCAEAASYARESGGYEQVVQADLNNLDPTKYFRSGMFDKIVFGDVLEHLVEPEEVLKRFLPLLAKSGKVVMSLPNVAHGSISLQLFHQQFEYMDYGVLDKTHLRFFTASSIAQLAVNCGLAVCNASRTIWDLEGMHSIRFIEKTSNLILNELAMNDKSFVLQYVVVLAPVGNDHESLYEKNYQKLSSLNDDELNLIRMYRQKYLKSIEKNEDCPLTISYRLKVSCKLQRIKSRIRELAPKPAWLFLRKTRRVLTSFFIAVRNFFRPNPSVNVLAKYKDQMLAAAHNDSESYVMYSNSDEKIAESLPKLIAFYLPQFHPFIENDEWWGKGFTEWTNVTKTVPQFVDHYQPQLPIDLGFYDLRVPEIMERQVELANEYGIHGFCFHYYWFSGKRLMEKPLFSFLKNKHLNISFCLCWANEPWSRRWDGSEDEVLMAQNHAECDDRLFFEDILPFISDERYMRICNKPVIIIYRPHLWTKEKVRNMAKKWRVLAKEHGFEGVYLVTALSHDFTDNPEDWGLDAGVEFPPHLCGRVPRVNDIEMVNPVFRGSVHDMRELVSAEHYMTPSSYTTFKTVFPAWDNTARKPDDAFIFHHASPDLYKKWLTNTISYTEKQNKEDEQYIFINAWNEWAEGAHLEPDRRYGYAYLQATREALLDYSKRK